MRVRRTGRSREHSGERNSKNKKQPASQDTGRFFAWCPAAGKQPESPARPMSEGESTDGGLLFCAPGAMIFL